MITLFPEKTQAAMRLSSLLIIGCGMALAFDLGGELIAVVRYPAHVSVIVWVHLALEAAATVGLGWAFALIRREERRSSGQLEVASNRLSALRGAFDADMRAKFALWGLSAAEQDVALLVVRGLGISEIAAARGTKEGTTKAQVHAVLRKSGAASRADLVASFLDGLLELGADAPADAAAP